ALGIGSMVFSNRADRGEGIAERLAHIGQHAQDLRIGIVLGLFASLMALVLGVTLYALTCDEDADVARMGLVSPVGEGVTGAPGLHAASGRLWLAPAAGPGAPAPDTSRTLATLFLRAEGGGAAATLFAVGSSCFCWLLLRGRMIPTWLAGLGLVASLLWVVV